MHTLRSFVDTAPTRLWCVELEIIYAHFDSTTTVGAAAHGAQGNPPESPSEWGQLMKTTHGGRTQVFERDFGNGQKVVTFVIWA